MPWKSGYTISNERTVQDRDVHWPDGQACSFTITVCLDPPCGPDGLTAADLRTGEFHYGMHAGLDALRALLDKHGYRATFLSSAVVARLYPSVLRSLAADGHEVAAHGYLREDVGKLEPAEERRRLQLTTEAIDLATGRRPLGWYSLARRDDKFAGGAVSPDTMSLLLEQGYTYMGNSPADDIPHYWVTAPETPAAILAMPYYYHFDDQFFLLFPAEGTGLEHADSLARNWRAEMAAQHRRGRSFVMVVRPYTITWFHRMKALGDFLDYVKTLDRVWNATALQCAEHWIKQYPQEKTLQLKPSIWKDYADSLS